jgi:hypothetical protein
MSNITYSIFLWDAMPLYYLEVRYSSNCCCERLLERLLTCLSAQLGNNLIIAQQG